MGLHGILQPFDNFYKNKRIKDGYRAYCKKCEKEYQEKNKNRMKEYKKQYYKENKDSLKQQQKIYNEENKDVLKVKSKKYREENKENRKEYLIRNKDKIREQDKQYRVQNKDKIKNRVKKYRKKNRDKIRLQENKYQKERRKNDPSFRLRGLISNVIKLALKKQFSAKNNSAWSKLPYTPQELKEYLEKQFEIWMNWENYRFI